MLEGKRRKKESRSQEVYPWLSENCHGGVEASMAGNRLGNRLDSPGRESDTGGKGEIELRKVTKKRFKKILAGGVNERE